MRRLGGNDDEGHHDRFGSESATDMSSTTMTAHCVIVGFTTPRHAHGQCRTPEDQRYGLTSPVYYATSGDSIEGCRMPIAREYGKPKLIG
jgi:hypothetical protein